jgi:hypothetical protein
MQFSYVADDVPPQHDDCCCEGRARRIHHPWAWRERDMETRGDKP